VKKKEDAGYDIEIAADLPLPVGYVANVTIAHATWSGYHVVRISDQRGCVAAEREDLKTQVTAAELDAAIERAAARIAMADRPTENAVEVDVNAERPTFEEVRETAHSMLGDVDDVLRVECRGEPPNAEQARALADARKYVAAARGALSRPGVATRPKP
jgi:hypothetical protein